MTPKLCARCGKTITLGGGGLTRDGKHYDLCHPYDGVGDDCYRLVTVYGHPLASEVMETASAIARDNRHLLDRLAHGPIVH